MDQDDQSNKPVDAAAAHKRKRRSSILKSQRPPRTPFSELEFNVATPTDTTKSRRVSFSKRTGVAEFITNEGTTTWENFYEEHNKSIETSGNDAQNPQKPLSIGQLGRRIFDQQFEEVEGIDFGGTFLPTQTLAQQLQNSLNNANITQQLAALECTGEKISLPQQNFELSELTEQKSKIFNDENTIPAMAEMSNQMNVDFSALQSKCDDLDEIQKDLNRVQQNVVGPTNFGNASEYIEVDLNMTSVGLRNDDDMSITETVHSPKVQELAKSVSKKSITDFNLEDKENIALNPYAPICESDNFVMEEKNEVLVFDGKKLTVQIEKKNCAPEPQPRKTIILNMDDDLPNFISEPKPPAKEQILYDDNISMTKVVPGKIIEERRTSIYNDCNMSTTQAVPTEIIVQNEAKVTTERRRTIIYNDDCNMSTTQAIPSKIIEQESKQAQNPEKRRTLVYDKDCDISMTQALSSNVIIDASNAQINKKRQTIVFENDGDLSLTQAVPTMAVIHNKENLTIPTDIINKKPFEANTERRQTVVFENDGDISMTQALPTNIVNALQKQSFNNRRKTIVFEDDGDISMTQAVPATIYHRNNDNEVNAVTSDAKPSVNYAQNKTLNYEDMDISYTQALPQNIILCNKKNVTNDESHAITNKNKTVLYDNEMDISITQAIPQSVFIAQIEKQGPVSRTNEVPIRIDKTEHAQILPIIESALVRECQATIQNDTNLQAESSKRDVSVTESVNTISKSNHIEKIMPENLVKKMDESSNVFSQPTDLDMSVGDVKMEATSNPNVFINKSCDDTTKTEYCQSKPVLSYTVTLEENLEDKEIKSENHRESISGHEALVYQSITNVRTSDEDRRENSNILAEKQSRVSIKHKPSLIEIRNENEMEECKSLGRTESIDRDKQIQEMRSEFEKPKNSVTGSVVSQISTKTKKSILNELLDMSTDSEECVDDKNIMAVVESRSDDIEEAKNVKNGVNIVEIKSSDVFRITRGSFDEFDEFKSKTDVEEKPAIDYNEECDVNDLKNKLQTLKTVSKNIRYEQVVSEDMKELDLNKTNTRKSFKNADDTRELLQMLSEFTDRPSLPPTIDEEDIYLKEEEKYGETQTEQRKITFANNRRSIVLSKEELLNNISMAQAALQESHYIDETFDEATEISNETIDVDDRGPKSFRISGDVVKELKFDDTDDDVIVSPLKKTAFGETSYMNESKEKSKVIPTYDVTDGIKELMSDLVKPMVDVLPFEAGNLDRSTKKTPSTISTQIQANLITSSQIDVDVELHSTPDSVADMNSSLFNKVASLGSKAIASVFPGPKIDNETIETPKPRNRPSVPGQVLTFDPSNPLNNVILSPRDYDNVHTYNPLRSSETLHSVREHSVQFTDSKEGNGRVETQYNVNLAIASGDAGSQITKSNTSIKSKPLSIDRSVEMKLNVKETEINTEIAMKPNSELLDAHSSLTLVDDALARSTFDVDLDTRSQSEENVKSPVRVIYEMNENGLSEKLESDVTSNDEEVEHPKKRSLSPCIPTTDLTPKPQSKIQKMSNSPQMTKPKKSITVQEIMTEFNITKTEQNAIVKQVNEAVDFEMRSVTSYASTQSARSEQGFTSDSSRVDFGSVSEQSSKNYFHECESSANVVAKIDMLPFMGTPDCEWEVTSGDTWSFLVLRSRVRVTVKCEHSYYNASRSSVRADTNILAVNVDMVHNDEKDPLIALGLRLASQSMQYECTRKCKTAGEVPAMLKRCVSISRTAVQWLRSMRDAMLRLAFRVDRDGCLTLKVANVRLRSVWELSMRIELTVGDAHEPAWPCATAIGISTIVADVDVPVDSLNGLIKSVPHDWGHVPRTIWKLFKYLKHKQRDDDFFGISILNMVK